MMLESLVLFAVDEGLRKGYTEDTVRERADSTPRCSKLCGNAS